MTNVTLYTKPDCTLCDEAHGAIERLRAKVAFEFHEVDVCLDADLTERYGQLVPVVEVDGAKVFEYQVDERELSALLARRKVGLAR